MSLDGLRETHDWFRKPGSFDCTLEKLKCLRKAGIETVIMTTVSDRNLKEIPELVDALLIRPLQAAQDADVDVHDRDPCAQRVQHGQRGLSHRAAAEDQAVHG